MAIRRFVKINMCFNYIKFGTDVRRVMDELHIRPNDVDELANYGHGNTAKFAAHMKPNPEMNTFLACCNALDLNPSHYFELQG